MSFRFRFRFLVALGCLALVSASSALAQKAAAAFAYKMERYSQGLTGAPVMTGAFFTAGFQFVEPQFSAVFFPAQASTSNLGVSTATPSVDGLTISGGSSAYPARALLNAAYPNGRVDFRFPGPFPFEGGIELTGDRYPAAPRVTNLPALQTIADGWATLEWQPGAGAQAGDAVHISLSDLSGDLLFSTEGDASGRTAMPMPSGREATGTITVQRTTARGESAGVKLAAGYSATTVFSLRSPGALDLTPPRVVATSPALDAVGVSPTARVQLTFDETMRPSGTLSGAALPPGMRQRVTWSEDRKSATFEFLAPMPAGPLELRIGDVAGHQAFRDLSGNSLPRGTVLARFFVGDLPVFTRQPESIRRGLNESVTLTPTVVWPGGGLTYQWFLDGVAVPGATSATLTLNNLDFARLGLYELRAANAHGAVLSAPALVSIGDVRNLPSASIEASQEATSFGSPEPITPGLPLTLRVRRADGVTVQYWRKNGVRIAGATGLELAFASLVESDTGIYDVVLANAYGTGASDSFSLHVKPGRWIPAYTVTREDRSAIRGLTGMLPTNTSIPYGFHRGWQHNGQWISQGGADDWLRLPDIQPQQAGVYRFYVSNGIESMLVAEHTLTVREPVGGAPFITRQPRDIWFSEGGSDTTSPSVEGAMPMTYQWKRNGVAAPGRTGSILLVTSDPAGQEGTYTCVITNAVGSAETRPIAVRFISSRAAPPKPSIGVSVGPLTSLVLRAGGVFSLQASVALNTPAATRAEWRRNGTPLTAGDMTNLVLRNLTPADSGAYTVVYGNSYGETESDPFRLRVLAPDEPPYRTEEKMTLRMREGSRLTLRAPFAGMPGMRYRWFLNGREVTAENAESPESGLFYILSVHAVHAGAWTVEASNPAGTATAPTADLIVEPGPPASARLVNVSTRASAGQGSATLIAGFALTGSGPKRMLLRAVGPALGFFGVRDAVKNPRLAVYRGTQLIASNDDWIRQSGVAAVDFAQRVAGAAQLDINETDAALVATLEPGAYTLQYLTDEPGGGAVGLIEAYDLDPGYPALRLTNLSSRLFVGTGEQTAIPGLVVRGTGSKTYLVRAVGPGLGKFGVAGVLADPQILVTGSWRERYTNDDWESANRTAIVQAAERVGAFALDAGSKDAAILVTLPAGDYTVQVAGAGGSTGVALVELYEVP